MFKTQLNNENFDFLKTCRLCLNQTNELTSIFHISSLEIQYLVAINECTSLKISEDDNLPKNICLECVDCLNKFYKFRKLVENSQVCLNEFLHKFWNNSNKNALMLENTRHIKEIESNDQTTSIKSEDDLPPLEDEDSEIESKIGIIVKEKLLIDENKPVITEPTTALKSSVEETDNSPILTTIHKSFNPSKCKSCGKKFKSTKAVKLHLKNCKISSNTNKAVSTSSLQLAKPKKLTNKSENKSYICVICGKSFSLLCNLKVHEKIHTGEKPFVCKQCNKAFGEKSKLKRHERIHTGEKLYNCKECDLSFIHLGQLRTHEKFHSGEKPFNCKECGKSFIYSAALREHERVHTGEKPYVCKQCGKCFTQSSSLGTHEKIHTGERPYSCKQCGKSFVYSYYLSIHERSHTGEKPYICDNCGKSFTNLSGLKRHAGSHKDEKLYSCYQCEKSFKHSPSLRRHEKIHQGEKSD